MYLLCVFFPFLLAGYCHAGTCNNVQGCQYMTCTDGNKQCNNNMCLCEMSSHSSAIVTSSTHGEICQHRTDCVVTQCNEHLHYRIACVGNSCICRHDPCLANPCPTSYTCTPTGYNSRRCHCTTAACINEHTCESKPCHHSGTCEELSHTPYYRCMCKYGWFGENCTDTICDDHLCYNGGVCSRLPGPPYFKCFCHSGYYGDHCEHEICSAGKCLYGGTCVPNDHTHRYTCACPSGHTGVYCEVNTLFTTAPTSAPTTPTTAPKTTASPTITLPTTTPPPTTASATTPPPPTTPSRTTPPATTSPLPKHPTAITPPTTKSTVTTPTGTHITDIPYDPNYGPFCLSCDDVVSPNTCEYLSRCGPHEICYVDSFVTSIGTIRYNLGCRDTAQCPNRKRSVDTSQSEDASTITVCTECCQDHICNSGGCGVQGYTKMTTAERGPICFHCDQAKSPSDCATISVCGRDEVCAIERTHVATTNQLLWKSVCMHSLECSKDLQTYQNHTNINVFSSPDHKYNGLVVGGHCRFMCCVDDLCNRRCPDAAVSLLG